MTGIEAAGIAFLLSCGVVLFGRFLLVGLRAREMSTLLIAFATLVGVAALAFLAAAIRVLESDPALSRWLAVSAVASGTLCVASNVGMTAVLFRRGNRLGWVVSGLFIAAMWATVIALVAEGGVDVTRRPSGWLVVNSILLIGTLTWGSLEAAVNWRFLRRQAALGLASSQVVNRVLFFGIASGATAIGGTLAAAALSLGVQFRGRGAAVALAILFLMAGAALLRSFGVGERGARRPPSPSGSRS